LSFNNQGTMTYEASADPFPADATPIAVRFTPNEPPRFVNPTGDPPDRFVQIRVIVGDTGTLMGGVPGDDLIVVGAVDDGHGSFYDGVLPTGEVTSFGFANRNDSIGTTQPAKNRGSSRAGRPVWVLFSPNWGHLPGIAGRSRRLNSRHQSDVDSRGQHA
jgi:hypothetical protein